MLQAIRAFLPLRSSRFKQGSAKVAVRPHAARLSVLFTVVSHCLSLLKMADREIYATSLPKLRRTRPRYLRGYKKGGFGYGLRQDPDIGLIPAGWRALARRSVADVQICPLGNRPRRSELSPYALGGVASFGRRRRLCCGRNRHWWRDLRCAPCAHARLAQRAADCGPIGAFQSPELCCSPKAGVKPAGAKSEEERVLKRKGLRGLSVGVNSHAKST